MKLLVVLALLGAAAAAPPAHPHQGSGQQGASSAPADEVQLLRFEADSDGLGTFNYAFEQSDGTKKEEQGELRNAGTDDEAIAVKGSYSWVAPDGDTYLVTYIADENGFQPTIEKVAGPSASASASASAQG